MRWTRFSHKPRTVNSNKSNSRYRTPTMAWPETWVRKRWLKRLKQRAVNCDPWHLSKHRLYLQPPGLETRPFLLPAGQKFRLRQFITLCPCLTSHPGGNVLTKETNMTPKLLEKVQVRLAHDVICFSMLHRIPPISPCPDV